MREDNADLGNIAQNAPLRLEVAARLAFPDGSMKLAGLRREISRGRLTHEVIAGKHYTTLADIAAMRELCRVPSKTENTLREQDYVAARGSLQATLRKRRESNRDKTRARQLRSE